MRPAKGELPERQKRFADLFIATGNGAKSYADAYGTDRKTGKVGASKLLKRPLIAAYVLAGQQKLQADTEFDARNLVNDWISVLGADPRELIEVHRRCCRHCHGEEFQFQFTRDEWRRAIMKAIDEGKKAPDALGGNEFNARRAPHPKCTECHGDGEPFVYVHDTRKLSETAAHLLVGVEGSSGGSVKLLMRDKEKAADSLARVFGMFIERHVDVSKMSDAELDELRRKVSGR